MEFIGRLHPLLVHLPIGILLLAVLFEWLPFRKPYKSLRRSIRRILWIGFITALASATSGYWLAQNGNYDSQAVKLHQLSGIALTVLSFVYAWARGQKQLRAIYKFLSLLVLALVIVTGHLGGTLTHGENFLFKSSTPSAIKLKTENLEQARLYADLVQPVLEARCYGCHGSTKQKGKLRLDSPDDILKGGKSGSPLVAGKADESELINRILLPADDEDHMPPKEREQLTEVEIKILHVWAASQNLFAPTPLDSGQLAAVRQLLNSDQRLWAPVPDGDPGSVDEAVVAHLRKTGAIVLPVAEESPYLQVNLINAEPLDSAWLLLTKLGRHVAWLKTGSKPITDQHLATIGSLTSLTRLNLEGTQITDAGMQSLHNLIKLQYLNLNETPITSQGLNVLTPLPDLQTLYLYRTRIEAGDIQALQQQFAKTHLEFGNYTTARLPQDTQVVTLPGTR